MINVIIHLLKLIHSSNIKINIIDIGFKKCTYIGNSTIIKIWISSMRIVQLTLSDFLLIKDSDISKIKVAMTAPVQLIIGTNGSGKSSWARQLSVYPSSRSLFGKKGFKSLVIEKDGFEYKLESEYEKPSSPHAFYEGDGDENINVGRTTDIQKELIVEHLGITPLVDDLIMNRIVFPKMKATARKEFLMANNPNDIGFISQELKKVSSKIRACKNNIARLQSRKILLEQDLLSQEDVDKLEEEKLRIQNDLTFFQNQMTTIQIGSGVIGTLDQVSLFPNTVKENLKKIRFKIKNFSHITRNDDERYSLKNNLSGQITSLKERLEEIDSLILNQSTELHDLEVQYRDLSPDGDLKEIENTISRLELDRDKLKIIKPDFEISKENLNSYYDSIETLRENLLDFQSLGNIPLYSSKKRTHREKILSSCRYKQSRYEMILADLRSQHEELSKRHSMSPSDIPDAPCSKDKCPLYAHFMEGYETTESKRTSIKLRIEKGERVYKRLSLFISKLIAYFNDTRKYHDKIQWLINEAQQNPILHSVLRSLDILSTLSSSPNRIYQNLKDKYDHVDQWIKYKEVLEQLEITNILKQRCMGSQSRDAIKLVVSIENLKKSLDSLRDEMNDTSVKIYKSQRLLDDICTYEGLKTEVLRLQESYEYYVNYLSNKHELDKLAYLRKSLEELRSNTYVRMSEVERTLRAQSGLKERYQEEVVNELNRIEKDLSELIQIEKALIEIPKEITIDFLNGLFEQANKIIEMVWTIPLKIEPLNYTDSLNYEFTVSGDNDTVREMSECSEGQTEILSLAINLALRIELGYLNIPLVLDETGRTFDEKHKQNLVYLLKKLLDEKIISQLFLISHHAVMHDSFNNTETLVIRQDNVMLPEVYNQHCEIV